MTATPVKAAASSTPKRPKPLRAVPTQNVTAPSGGTQRTAPAAVAGVSGDEALRERRSVWFFREGLGPPYGVGMLRPGAQAGSNRSGTVDGSISSRQLSSGDQPIASLACALEISES